ncbi:MAG: DUF4290 domain-containing protein [Bacteroidia bacterium]
MIEEELKMEYNSNRPEMVIREYGRNIQKMIEFTIGIEDREKRTAAAHEIIDVMSQINPGVRGQGDYKHKLWDHLHLISHFRLDVEAPYPPPEEDTLKTQPDPIPYASNNIKLRHYGRIVEQMIKTATEMEDGEAKEELVDSIASYMRMSYKIWNDDKVTDEKVLNDLKNMSGGKLQPDTIKGQLKIPDAPSQHAKRHRRDYRTNKGKGRKNFRRGGKK